MRDRTDTRKEATIDVQPLTHLVFWAFGWRSIARRRCDSDAASAMAKPRGTHDRAPNSSTCRNRLLSRFDQGQIWATR